ncbi:MAG: response regulator [Wenzhouxiangella sp.]|jgi:twitching motility two-component system response regulator PilH|nr:response regulator [Wenzhouxiangella sp.]
MARVLIVDDSEVQLYALRKVLEKEGHEVFSADNGQEGIDLAVKEHPDLILMDVVMPEMSGFQATRKLHRNPETKEIPIVFVTTKDQESDRVWGMRQGAAAYITKPVDRKLLLSTIKNILENDQ